MRAAPTVQKDGPRINEEIRNREVQLIDQTGHNHGTVEIGKSPAHGSGSRARPRRDFAQSIIRPSCKILDFGKYKYQAQKKAAEARKKQKVVEVKEIKFRPMIDDHDYDVKMRSMQRFFEEGDKVKVTLRFRGREMAHQELGTKLLDRVKEDISKIAKVESGAPLRRPPDGHDPGAALTANIAARNQNARRSSAGVLHFDVAMSDQPARFSASQRPVQAVVEDLPVHLPVPDDAESGPMPFALCSPR